MTGWVRRVLRRRAERGDTPLEKEVPVRSMEPIHLRRALKGLEGNWVALKDGEPIDAASSPYELYMKLKLKGARGATIVRVPDPAEPEIVGLG